MSVEAGESRVTAKADQWVEIEAEQPDGFRTGPVELRPGADETKIRLHLPGSSEQEIRIYDLREGISQIEKEHAR